MLEGFKCTENLPETIFFPIFFVSIYMVAQMVKNLSTTLEIQIGSLGQEDLLEEGMANHSRILAWRIPRTEKPDGLQSIGPHRIRHD